MNFLTMGSTMIGIAIFFYVRATFHPDKLPRDFSARKAKMMAIFLFVLGLILLGIVIVNSLHR
jgi:hypothetical protein